MKRNIYQVVWGAVAALGLSLAAVSAADQTSAGTVGASPLANAEPVARVMHHQVVTSDNQKEGKVANLVLAVESGRVLYAVVGTDKGPVAVPPQIFGRTTDNTVHLKVTKQQLESAPQFNSAVNVPGKFNQASFVAQVYQHFNQPAWWQGAAPVTAGVFNNVHKVSQLFNMRVENVSNQPLGKISHIVVDMPAGRLLYLVLTPAPRLNLGNNLYALPPEAFTLSANQQNLVSNLTAQKLAAAPHFTGSHMSNLTDVAFASQVYQYYGKQPWFQTSGAVQPTGR